MMKRVLSILLAVTLLLTLSACGKKESPVNNEPTGDMVTEAKRFLEAYVMRDRITQFSYYCYDERGRWEDRAIEDNGSAEGFFATAQSQADEKGLDVHVDSFDSYYEAFYEVAKQTKLEHYGEFTYTVEATKNVKMEEAEAAEFLADVMATIEDDYKDPDVVAAIQDIYTITVRISIDGEKRDWSESYLVHMTYCNDKWQVVSHSI